MMNFATVGTNGVCVYKLADSNVTHVMQDESDFVRTCSFSRDGNFFAYCNSKCVSIRNMQTKKVVSIDQPRTSKIHFSPTGQIVCLYESFSLSRDATPEERETYTNFNLYGTLSGEFIKGYVHRSSENWHIYWTHDESVALKVQKSEAFFMEKNDFSRYAQRLVWKDMQTAALGLNSQVTFVAAFCAPGAGLPSCVRIFRYPAVDASKDAIATRTFFKAESAKLMWNDDGTCVLVIASVGAVADNYYGEDSLHFMSATHPDNCCRVETPKVGPIHDVKWKPGKGCQFVVTHGHFPAQTTVFNQKCDSIFDFGTGTRNSVSFNMQASIIALIGSGNIQNKIELWDYEKKTKIVDVPASSLTKFEWAHDGLHFVTATTAPRLNVNNKFIVWDYLCNKLFEKDAVAHSARGEDGKRELWDILWRPLPQPLPAARPIVPANFKPPADSVEASSAAASKRYVPPSLRNRPTAAPLVSASVASRSTNGATGNTGDAASPSKTALKNKKKREKAKAKVESGGACGEEHGTGTSGSATAEAKDQSTALPYQYEPTGNVEKDKKLRKLSEKLNSIHKIKISQSQGKTLEINQIEKLGKEAELLREFKKLCM